MKFKGNFFVNYLKEAPVSLAIERTFECEIFKKQEFRRPILDLGCGEGLFAYILSDDEIDVGIDPNARELKRAKAYGIYKELINCYGHDIPKNSNSFNTIYSNSVLEHIVDIESVLKEVYRLLTPEGYFYVTVPTNFFDNYTILYQLFLLLRLNRLAYKYRLFFNKFWRHYHCYDDKSWLNLFLKNGFEAAKVQKYANKKVCLINDILAPFSTISFIEKKIFNRWFLFKSFRSLYVPLLKLIFCRVLQNDSDAENCGLIFFCLKKI